MVVFYFVVFFVGLATAAHSAYKTSFNVAVVITVHDRTTYIEHVIQGWSNCWKANETAVILGVDGHPPTLGSFYEEIENRYSRFFESFVIHYMDIHDRQHSNENVKKAWLASLLFGLAFAPREDTVVVKSEDDWYPAKDAIIVAKHLMATLCSRCAVVNIGNWAQFDDTPTTDLGYFLFEEERLHNFGMSWTREAFRRLFLPHVDFFARYGDHNWDWTIGAMMQAKIFPDHTVRPKMSRLLHVGKCGGAHYQSDKSPEDCKKEMILSIADFDRMQVGRLTESISTSMLIDIAKKHANGQNLKFYGPDSGWAPTHDPTPERTVEIYREIIRRFVPAHIGYNLPEDECAALCGKNAGVEVYDPSSSVCGGYIRCSTCVRMVCPSGYTFTDAGCKEIDDAFC